MHSFAAAAAFTEKQRRGGGGEAEYGHKAYLYTTCIYVETWIFNISVQLIRHLVVQRSAERASVCVCPSEVLNNCGQFLIGSGPESTSEVNYIDISSLFRNPTPRS